MKILYGVVGEGMGHATRSRVVLDHLSEEHDIQVVVSGRAYDYLQARAKEARRARAAGRTSNASGVAGSSMKTTR